MRVDTEKTLVLSAAAVLWAFGSVFAVAPAGLLLSALAKLPGAGAMERSLAAAVVVEGLVYFGVALGVFALVRLASPPRGFWIAGPIGYVVGVGLWFALTWIAGREMTPEAGYGLVFSVDLAAVTAGSALGMRRRGGGDSTPSL